jgi:hypothetical protein
MPLLEMVNEKPDWRGALAAALIRPAGVPERRAGQDHWSPPAGDRPRRISDDLAWLRRAVEDPGANGLRALPESAAVAAWEPAPEGDPVPAERLGRLEDRGVLYAAGFLLHEDDLRAALS